MVEIAGHQATTCPACARRIRGEQLRLIQKTKAQIPLTEPPRTEKKRKRVRTKSQPIEKSVMEYELVEDFGTRIKKAREELGLKIEHIAKAINIKTSTLSKIEAGKIVPSYEVARALEKTLDVKIIIRGTSEISIGRIEQSGPPPPITLGELANLKEKKRRR